MSDENELEYAGFWLRVWATLIDTVLLMMITAPLARFFLGGFFSYGELPSRGLADFLISFALPAAAVIGFWTYKHATPGKMAIHAKIVDARTGGAPSTTQHLIRYVGYFVSVIPLCLGLLWVAFDSRKQGWHDKMAGTVVVRPKTGVVKPVQFET